MPRWSRWPGNGPDLDRCGPGTATWLGQAFASFLDRWSAPMTEPLPGRLPGGMQRTGLWQPLALLARQWYQPIPPCMLLAQGELLRRRRLRLLNRQGPPCLRRSGPAGAGDARQRLRLRRLRFEPVPPPTRRRARRVTSAGLDETGARRELLRVSLVLCRCPFAAQLMGDGDHPSRPETAFAQPWVTVSFAFSSCASVGNCGVPSTVGSRAAAALSRVPSCLMASMSTGRA